MDDIAGNDIAVDRVETEELLAVDGGGLLSILGCIAIDLLDGRIRTTSDCAPYFL